MSAEDLRNEKLRQEEDAKKGPVEVREAPQKETQKATKKGKKKAKKKVKKKVKKKTKKKVKKKTAKKSAPVHFWATGSASNTKDKFFLSPSKGTNSSGLVGVDYKLNTCLTIGAYYSHGYAPSYNTRALSHHKAETDSVFSFVKYNFTPQFFANVLVGYAYTPTKIRRLSPPNPNLIFSKSKTSVLSASPTLNLTLEFCDLKGSFQAGYGYTNSTSKRHVDSINRVINGKHSQGHKAIFFADIAYPIKNLRPDLTELSPYVQGGVDHNLTKHGVRGPQGAIFYRARDSYKLGTGLRFNVVDDVTLSIGWQRTTGHSGRSSNVYNLTLRVGAF